MNKIIKLPKQLLSFFQNVIQEIKIVEFPSRKETFKMTYIVLIISIVFTFFLLGLDLIFSILRNYLTKL